MFATPFSVEAEDAPSNMQMELTEMQRNIDLRKKFMNECVVEFYWEYVKQSQFPAIPNHALFIASLSGTTYTGEQIFFENEDCQIKINKSADGYTFGKLTENIIVKHQSWYW